MQFEIKLNKIVANMDILITIIIQKKVGQNMRIVDNRKEGENHGNITGFCDRQINISLFIFHAKKRSKVMFWFTFIS